MLCLMETLDMHGIGICSNYWIVNPVNNDSFGSGERIIQSGGARLWISLPTITNLSCCTVHTVHTVRLS